MSDGSTLTNLAGYRIYYGRNANILDQSIVAEQPWPDPLCRREPVAGELVFLR